MPVDYEFIIDGEIFKGTYVPFKGADNVYFIPKTDKTNPDIYIHREKRIGDNLDECKQGIKDLTKLINDYTLKYQKDYKSLSLDDHLDYSSNNQHRNELEKYLSIYGNEIKNN